MPYRKRDIEERAAPEGDAGIVGDLVRQFADPYAFFRELVQNAIDAGSADIRVDIARDTDGALTISVRDRGEGMDRDILENKLLVLFRSGKEGVAGKIGKFGIGFVSVLALGPSVVKVQSTRGRTGHTLHLYADHSYELFEHGGGTPGTTVTLVVPIAGKAKEAAVVEHVQRSRASLTRWCEHAQVPIELRVDESAFGKGAVERVDRPMQLDGALCVASSATSDRRTQVVVGLHGRPGQRAAFYNRGLLLAETEEDLGLPGLTVKVQDVSLEHTLSRDNVRRDEHFHQALRLARSTAHGALRKAVHEALVEASASRDRYFGIALAVTHTRLDPLGFPLPLLRPPVSRAGGDEGPSHVVVTKGEKLRAAREHSTMTALLAERGEHVVDAAALPELFARRLRGSGVQLDEAWLRALSAVELMAVAPGSADEQLLSAVRASLDGTYRAPSEVLLGTVHGAHGEHVAIGRPDDAGRPEDPFTLLPFRRAPLVLNAAHPLVKHAREAAQEHPTFGADLIVRGLLEELDELNAARSERLVADTLGALLGPGEPTQEGA